MERRPDDIELVRLVLTRQRRQGVPFAVAWGRALSLIPPLPGKEQAGRERAAVIDVLHLTRAEWARAYARQPRPEPPNSDRLQAERAQQMLEMRRSPVPV